MSKHQIQLTRDGTAEPVTRNQILRRERGQGNTNFSCSADHEQDWHLYSVNSFYATLHVILIHTYINASCRCIMYCCTYFQFDRPESDRLFLVLIVKLIGPDFIG